MLYAQGLLLKMKKINWNKKRTIILLVSIVVILLGVLIYSFIINPQIQSTKIDFYNQGINDVLIWIDNQIQIDSQVQINLDDKQIICKYG